MWCKLIPLAVPSVFRALLYLSVLLPDFQHQRLARSDHHHLDTLGECLIRWLLHTRASPLRVFWSGTHSYLCLHLIPSTHLLCSPVKSPVCSRYWSSPGWCSSLCWCSVTSRIAPTFPFTSPTTVLSLPSWLSSLYPVATSSACPCPTHHSEYEQVYHWCWIDVTVKTFINITL